MSLRQYTNHGKKLLTFCVNAGPSVDRYAGPRLGICLYGPSVDKYAGPRVGICLHGPSVDRYAGPRVVRYAGPMWAYACMGPVCIL